MNLDSLWNLVLAASLRGSVLIAAVLLLRWLTRWLPAQCFHLLWLLVALKLLVPIAPTAPWSVFNLRPSSRHAAMPAKESGWRVTLDAAPEDLPVARVQSPLPPAARQAAGAPVAAWSTADVIPFVWLLGVAIQSGLLARGVWRMRRSLRQAKPCVEPRVREVACEVAARLGLRRVPPILEVDAVQGPAVAGALLPRLLLPVGLAARLSDDELRFVLAHEFAHVRRGDLAGLWLMTLARTLHWFNPLAWLAARFARADAELACDAAVLRKEPGASEAYAVALLNLATLVSWRPAAVPLAGIVESAGGLRERVRRIAEFAPGGRGRVALSGVIVLGAGVLFGANETAPSPSAPVTESAPAAPATPEPFPEVGFPEAWANFVKTVPFNTKLTSTADFAKGWTVTALSLSQRINDAVIYVHIRRTDGDEFTLLNSGASHRGVVLERVDWRNPNRPQIVLRKGTATTTLAFPAAPAGEAAPGKFAETWKVVGISRPPPDNDGALEVDLETDYGATMNLLSGRRVEGGLWAEVKEPNDAALPLEVALYHGDERALLSADRSLVAVRANDSHMRPHIEFEGKYLEFSKDNFARLGRSEFAWMRKFARLASTQTASGIAGVLTAEQRDAFVTAATGDKVTLLSAPRVMTKSGQRAVIEIIREFRYPVAWDDKGTRPGFWTPTSFETRNCGVTLEVEPTLGPDGTIIDLKLTPQVVELLGFIDFSTRKAVILPKLPKKTTPSTKPIELFGEGVEPPQIDLPKIAPGKRLVTVFSARKVSADVSIFDGQTVVLGPLPETEETKPFKSKAADKVLFVLVTARRINRDGQPFHTQAAAPSNSTPAPASLAAPDSPAVALPVPEKPGFVRSPYAPDAGYIDVRGFPPGTEVKCPYSGKIVRVP